MSLIVYDKLSDIPEDILYVHNPALFFDNGGSSLPDTKLAKYILGKIEDAIYVGTRCVQFPWKSPI